MKRLATTIVLSSFLTAVAAWSQGPTPVGDQFQVNTYTTDSQRLPAVATDAQGNFVVVWEGYGSGTDIGGASIHARRYDATGAPLGDQFQINSYTTGFQWDPRVTVTPQGNFVVIWGSMFSAYESNRSVQAQRFSSNGTPVGGQFQVNSYTTGVQGAASIDTDSQGNFVVVWHSNGSTGSDTDEEGIQARLYNANGVPMGSEFQVNTYTTNEQTYPSIAMDGDGDFVVVWQSDGSAGSDTTDYSIQGQRFSTNGTPVGGQFQVNSANPNEQRYPFVAVDSDGEFVVAWQSEGTAGADNSGYGIRAQRFNAAGAMVGAEFQVNSYTTADQFYPVVSTDSDGDFVVVWHSYGSPDTDVSATSIQGQSFAANGAPIGSQFQVNAYTTSYQTVPSVVHRPGDDILVVWDSKGSFGTDTGGNGGFSIQGLFMSSQIFSDGFESGDTSVWSTVVP